MRFTANLSLLLLAAFAASSISAQPPKRTAAQMKAAYEAHHGDFDYLLGDWEFTSTSAKWGKSHGYWSAVRLDQGQVVDEFRVVGDKGETYSASTTIRSYNAPLDRWELITTDGRSGLQDVGTAQREGGEMHIEQTFGAMSDEPAKWRIRYYNIQADRFSWTADRSADGGKTWAKDYEQIEARRIGPSRSIGPLATGRKQEPTR